VWVKGDKKAAYIPALGSCVKGMNMPLMNMRGIRKKLSGIITSPGLPVGIEAKRIPIAE